MVILDTNVVSELMKAAPEPAVERWLAEQPAASVFICAITEAELRHGVALMPDGRRRATLSAAVAEMLEIDFGGRILPFDSPAAIAFAQIAAERRSTRSTHLSTGRPDRRHRPIPRGGHGDAECRRLRRVRCRGDQPVADAGVAAHGRRTGGVWLVADLRSVRFRAAAAKGDRKVANDGVPHELPASSISARRRVVSRQSPVRAPWPLGASESTIAG